jgi:hypothetical protein
MKRIDEYKIKELTRVTALMKCSEYSALLVEAMTYK